MGEDLVQAALRAASNLGKDVADVPVIAIAREAGISRSTLLRRLGGARVALDEAVRAAGVDPGGQAPVRIRALDAAAALISTTGLASATLEAIAAHAQCSVHSLHAVFGGRDDLLRAVFDRHSPLLDIEDFTDSIDGELSSIVRQLYGLITRTLGREPRVAPAVLAEALARPDSPAIQNLLGHNAPRMLASIGAWLTAEVKAGRIRDLPLPLLIQQLLAPVVMHMLLRPAMPQIPGMELPDVDTVCDIFTETFVRAAGTSPNPRRNIRRAS
ncbi:MAG: TetR/AcrR family transcriptional regulator [Mycobacterium sp.]